MSEDSYPGYKREKQIRIGLEKECAALRAERDVLRSALRDVWGTLQEHHTAGYREPGALCSYCTADLHKRIDALLTEEETGGMNIFMICPVRNATDEMRAGIEAEVSSLEAQGHNVYYPARDTDQTDRTGLNICKTNRAAIEQADEVYIIWDGQSTGSLFDLGMAFAMRKKIVPVVGRFPAMSSGKSFQNMVYAWQEEQYAAAPKENSASPKA